MSLAFEAVEIPKRARAGRTALPNPFTDLFPLDEEARTFEIPDGPNTTEARRLVRQARQAAKAVDRSAQINMTETPEGGTQFTVWTTERITRA